MIERRGLPDHTFPSMRQILPATSERNLNWLVVNSQEILISPYEKNSKNLSLYLRLYNTGKVQLDCYGSDLDSENRLVKKEQHNLTFWVDNSKKVSRIYVGGEKVAKDLIEGEYMGAKGETIIEGWDRVNKGLGKDEVRVWNRALEENEILESIKTEMPINSQR